METRTRPQDDPAAVAFRRAAVEHHRRVVDTRLGTSSVTSELAALAGRRDPCSVLVVLAQRSDADVADAELQDQIERRVRSVLRRPEDVHRLDRRLVVIVHGDRYAADAVARRIVTALAAPFSVAGADLTVAATVGVTELLEDDSPTEAVHRAGLAAHRAVGDPRRIGHRTARAADPGAAGETVIGSRASRPPGP